MFNPDQLGANICKVGVLANEDKLSFFQKCAFRLDIESVDITSIFSVLAWKKRFSVAATAEDTTKVSRIHPPGTMNGWTK